MAGKVLTLDDVITKDQLACRIADHWRTWNMQRAEWVKIQRELRNYIYATDTTHTSNSKLPWSNKTTLPKLTQIRDNLFANYVATMFPKRRWMIWEGADKTDETKSKSAVIRDYMSWAINQREFKEEIYKLVLDYIDTGNCFGTVEWVDESTVEDSGETKIGYIGPRIVRISPMDIVFNPISTSFSKTPKIVRVLTNIGEAKEMLSRFSMDEEQRLIAEGVFEYARELRNKASSWGDITMSEKDNAFYVDGFDNFRSYLDSGTVELLFFYGDMYDVESDTLYKNYEIVVIDRHKILIKRPHWYSMAEIPIYHSGWRVRQDNLWAMGPLDNLVGLQYRLDHVENMKADIFDLTTFPPVKIKGMVNDFTWGPLERIYIDSDGDVELMSPRADVLQANIEIASIETRMEEMAGSPKEAMGFRTPGEKTAYEVQRLENAASRIFQNKISQFEEQIIEPLLNAMLILAQNHLEDVTIRVIEDEFKSAKFRSITKQQLSANGRLRAVGARHFAEKAELVQNLNNFFSSALGADQEVKLHFSSVKLAKMIEDILNLDDYELVQPWVRVSEQAEYQQLANTQQENVANVTAAPSGLTPDDYSNGPPV